MSSNSWEKKTEMRGDVIFPFGNELGKEKNNENEKSFGNELKSPNGELEKLPIRSIYPIIPMGKMRTE
jgi:hypothetical protein